ncbi:hypothetical protein [Streptomyces sp. TRM64462]|uniref:hypothetical protein n=1 Tax=Streptomyces sp. TRM64462 TaxID=2741726 RepID=UPI001586BB23|nr:hypothetical protein [Streptomyces sp. TRM64462]
MSDPWGYPTPSQAEGEREPAVDEHPDVARTTPSQAEGERLPDGENEIESEGTEGKV